MKLYIAITVVVVLTSCPKSITTMPPLPSFDYQGHRGCRGLLPENTIPAMLKALELGVTTLEMDVVITHDKQVILSHEPFFNNEITTTPNGSYITEKEEKSLNIFLMRYDSIISYDVGLKPHPRFKQQQKIAATKPTLQQVIQAVKKWCNENNKALPFFNIETKSLPITDNIYHPVPNEFVALLMQVIMQEKIQNHTIIQSFDIRTLRVVQQFYQNIKTALLIEDTDKKPIEQQLAALGFTPTIYSPHFSLVNEALVNFCKAKKISLIPWTVNDLTTILLLKKMGVDGIITDYPNLFNL